MNWEENAASFDYATYSPEDNKIRIYSGRVSRTLYVALRDEGFQRAPQQGNFFQVWTPQREDIALALCDEIVDEDSTMEDRADARSERLATYSGNAAARFKSQYDEADRIAKYIPLGQPILVGHHSEKRHRRDLERIQNKTRKAFEEYDRSKYWAQRAESAKRHAVQTFDPGVIGRRIKKIQADKRSMERREPSSFVTRWLEHYTGQILYWNTVYTEITGKDITDQRPVKKGDWVQYKGRAWGQVIRVNRSRATKLVTTVTIDQDTIPGWMMSKWAFDKVSDIREGRPE